MRALAALALVLAAGCATVVRDVGPLAPTPFVALSRGSAPLAVDLAAVKDSFTLFYRNPGSTTEDPISVHAWRETLVQGFATGLRDFYVVQSASRGERTTGLLAPDFTVVVDEASVDQETVWLERRRKEILVLHHRARLVDSSGREVGHSFGVFRSHKEPFHVAPEPDGRTLIDFVAPLTEVAEHLVEQVTRDLLVPLEAARPARVQPGAAPQPAPATAGAPTEDGFQF